MTLISTKLTQPKLAEPSLQMLKDSHTHALNGTTITRLFCLGLVSYAETVRCQ